MEDLAPIILSVVLIPVGLYYIGGLFLDAYCKRTYEKILQNPKTACDIDAFVGEDYPLGNKAVIAHVLRFGNRQASLDAIPLEVTDSPFVPGLKVTRKKGTGKAGANEKVENLIDVLHACTKSKKKPVVIATIRMGFGHHRLAYAAASWAVETGHVTLFHDLLNITSEEADLIKSTDDLYSRVSRFASEMGGPIEKFLGSITMTGDENALRVAALTAAHLQPLMLALPKDVPVITSHQLCALTASAIGFTNVINLVVDNHPQWFLTVPNTLNGVQGPVNYESFLRMGVKPAELAMLGHWCPAQLVKNIDKDCKRRIERAHARADNPTKHPLRILIPVGGAGAQRRFIVAFVEALAPLVKQGMVHLFLNAGDHVHMKTAFLEILDACKLEFDTVTTNAGVNQFQERLLHPPPRGGSIEALKPVTLFCFQEYFPAVATTDILCRVADVLACKPSELAFWCLPKLHIRRVGDHEADSAKRASELGDGTTEAREIKDAMKFIDLMRKTPDLLVSQNQQVMKNNTIHVYDGCKEAVKIVLERAKAAKK